MTNDPVAVHAGFARRRDIPFTLLADRKAEIIGAFGLIDERHRGSPWYGLAIPMTFVIDAKGVITHRFSSANYRERIPVGVVLRVLRKRAEE